MANQRGGVGRGVEAPLPMAIVGIAGANLMRAWRAAEQFAAASGGVPAPDSGS